MGLIAPLALGFLGLALPIILLYMLKLRRQETPVSSTFLWMRVLRDRQANQPWQRLQRNLLLLLQLLILALIALAAARPFFETPSPVTGNIIVLLDGSASMQATDVKPSRFEAAKTAVSNLIDGLGQDDQVTLVLVSSQAEVVVSTPDKPAVKSALSRLKATNGEANFADAIAVAVASAETLPNSTIVIVGDGSADAIPPARVPVPVRFLPVGTSSNNLALSPVSLRDSSAGPQLFLGVVNYGETAGRGLVSIYVDGQLFDSREVEIGPHEATGLTWAVPPSTGLVEARLEVADDLAADNVAWASRASHDRVKALLVGEENLFLERALSLLPAVDLAKMPGDTSTLPEGFDLYILDGVAPTSLPRGGMLIINPPQDNSLASVKGEAQNLAVTKLQSTDPLLRYVGVGDLRIATASRIEPPEWSRVLMQSDEVPLLMVGEKDGRRIAILPFDLHGSNLPLLVAFPVLTANLVEWLGSSGSLGLPSEVTLGDPLTLSPDPKARGLEIVRPDGSHWQASLDGASVIYAETSGLGIYEVIQQLDSGDKTSDRFAVNFTAQQESEIAPSPAIPLEGEAPLPGDGQAQLGTRELWWPLLAAGFALLLVEWWVDRGRKSRRKPLRSIRELLR